MMKEIQRLLPGAPSNLIATAIVSGTQQGLAWTAPSRTATGYNVYYRLVGDTAWTLAGNTAGTSYTISGMTAGQKYQFMVRTVNSYGESTLSNILTTVLIDTATGASALVQATACDSGQLRIQVAGRLRRNGGVLTWESDGLVDPTEPATMQYGPVAANCTMLIRLLFDSCFNFIYFNCDPLLQNGWYLLIDDDSPAVSLNRIDNGAATLVQAFENSFGSPGSMNDVIITVNENTITVSIDGAQLINATVTNRPYKTQQVIGIGGYGFSRTPCQFDEVRVLTSA